MKIIAQLRFFGYLFVADDGLKSDFFEQIQAKEDHDEIADHHGVPHAAAADIGEGFEQINQLLKATLLFQDLLSFYQYS